MLSYLSIVIWIQKINKLLKLLVRYLLFAKWFCSINKKFSYFDWIQDLVLILVINWEYLLDSLYKVSFRFGHIFSVYFGSYYNLYKLIQNKAKTVILNIFIWKVSAYYREYFANIILLYCVPTINKLLFCETNVYLDVRSRSNILIFNFIRY